MKKSINHCSYCKSVFHEGELNWGSPTFPICLSCYESQLKSDNQSVTERKFEETGLRIGRLVEEKNKSYGDAFDKAGDFLKLLYPNGIEPNQYGDMLVVARVFDKLMRVATDKDAFGENPWEDIVGYGILKSTKGEDTGDKKETS